jgi:5-methylcytosine-specific restriction endonuclease McrA
MARDYKKEYREYQGTEAQKHNRAERNHARRVMEREGKVHKGDGNDVDHKHPLITGGSNEHANWRVQTAHNNRNFKRDSKGRPI